MATLVTAPSEPVAGYDSYKYQWTRYLARQNLQKSVKLLGDKLNADPNLPNFTDLATLAKETDKLTFGEVPEDPGHFKVGIVGAGCAGLFTAMILDYLNSRVEGLKIEYDILEAAGKERLGGRLYTHYFSEGEGSEHDYYDVGAMRFPNNDIMRRTFQLFKLLGIDKGKGKGKLIKYYMKDEGGVAPTYYNDVCHQGAPKGDDPYDINRTLPDWDKVRPDLLLEEAGGAGEVVSKTIKPFTDAFKKFLDEKRTSGEASNDGFPEADPGWKLLMKADFLSTREYFRSDKLEGLKDINGKPINGPGYNFNTIEWLETFAYATGWYNQSLSETVLEELDFTSDDWYCIEGGTQQVATKMAEKIHQQPEFQKRVTAIKQQDGRVTLTIKDNDPKALDKKPEQREYFAVFNSTTLAALQRMDLTQAGLRYGTKQAIRTLSYGASCKVAMKFKTGWWMQKPHNIKGGLGKTDLPLRVCVYPSYNLDDAGKNCVLLCSYTWAQDAQRVGSLITPDTPNKDPKKDEAELLELLFHNLALLHATKERPYEQMLDKIKSEYITHHSWDWYCDMNMNGAFAYFGPGEYSSMWPEIVKPNSKLFLIGEAASAHHAWIVGALESAVRGVYQLFQTLVLEKGMGHHEPFQKAMRLLEKSGEGDEDLPFAPLPREMPLRQLGTNKDTETVDLPADASNKAPDLTFTAAQVIISFFELLAETAELEAQLKGQGASGGGSNIALRT